MNNNDISTSLQPPSPSPSPQMDTAEEQQQQQQDEMPPPAAPGAAAAASFITEVDEMKDLDTVSLQLLMGRSKYNKYFGGGGGGNDVVGDSNKKRYVEERYDTAFGAQKKRVYDIFVSLLHEYETMWEEDEEDDGFGGGGDRMVRRAFREFVEIVLDTD